MLVAFALETGDDLRVAVDVGERVVRSGFARDVAVLIEEDVGQLDEGVGTDAHRFDF